MKRILYILFIVFIASCAKEEPLLPPNVSFTSPLENAFFNVPSAIHVRANINSETIVETATVRLVDIDYNPQSEQITIEPNESSFELDDFISVEDIYLESGSYYIEIIATSQGVSKKKYRSINLNEYPREYEGLFVAHYNGDVTIVDGEADSLDALVFSGNFGSEATDLALVNNYHSQNIIAKSNGNIYAYAKSNNELLWDYSDSDPVNLTFYNDAHVYEENRSVYFSNNKGQIVGLNESGVQVDLIEVDNSGLGVEQFIIDNDLLICEVNISNIESKLKVYSMLTGELIQQTPVLMDIENIVIIGEGKYLLAGAAIGSSEVQMQIYHSESNAFFSPEIFDIGQVYDIETTDSGIIAVAHSTGVYAYNENDNSINLISSYPEVSEIEYDEANDVLILQSGNQLVYYSLIANTELNSIYLNQEVASFKIMYNK